MGVFKNKKTFLIELLILVLFSIWIGPVNTGSIFRGDINVIDEGQFGAWVYHMVQGKKMYKDIFITYGPLYVQPLYVLFKLFGSSVFLTRVFLTFGIVIGQITILLSCYYLEFPIALRYFVLGFSLLVPIIQIRQALGLLTVLIFSLFLKEKKYSLVLVSGVLTSTTFLVSPEIGIFSFFICISNILYLFLSKQSFLFTLKRLCYYLLSVFAIVCLFVLWSYKDGWFFNYLNSTIDVLFSFSGIQVPNGQNFPNIILLILNTKSTMDFIKVLFSKEAMLYYLAILYLFSFFYFTVLVCIRKVTQKDIFPGQLLLYGFLLYTILLTRSGIGHFFFILSPCVLLLMYFVKKLTNVITVSKNKSEKRMSLIFVVFIFLFLVRILLLNRPAIAKTFNPLSLSTNIEFDHIFISKQQENQIEKIKVFVSQNTNEKDTVFFLSNDPVFYLLVKRENPSRYDLPYLANTLPKRYELIQSILLKKPKFIFDDVTAWDVDGVSNWTRIPELRAIVNKEYEISRTVVGITIYKIKNL